MIVCMHACLCICMHAYIHIAIFIIKHTNTVTSRVGTEACGLHFACLRFRMFRVTFSAVLLSFFWLLLCVVETSRRQLRLV